MELINSIKDRWHSLQTREQRILRYSSVVIGLLLLYLLIIDPVYSGRDSAEQRLRSAQEAFSVMQQQAADLKASLSATHGMAGSGPLLTLVESSAQKENLRSALKRLQPSGNDQIQVNLEGASYAQVMQWLSNLQHQGVRAQRVDIQVDRSSNLLEVQLVLAR